MKRFALGAAAAVSLLFSACQSTSTAAADPAGEATVNAVCPIVPAHDVDPAVTVDYRGNKVGFCCSNCIGKWEALDDAGKTAALEKAGYTMKSVK